MQLLTGLHRCHIVVITFTASIESAKEWREESQCSFELFADPHRTLYRHLAFPGKAYARVWNISTLEYYADQKLSGKRLPSALDPNDDPNQMGGDVLVNRLGEIIYLHRSQTPTDRPSVKQLQSLLDPIDP